MKHPWAPAAGPAPLRIGLVLAAALLAAACATPSHQESRAEAAGTAAPLVLVLRTSEGRALATFSPRDGRFDHVFVHSVHKSPVVERFRLGLDAQDEPVLELYELRYQDAGVGMPTDVEGGFRLEDGVFILEMNRRFRSVRIKVSVVAGHGIVVDGISHPFTEWLDPGKDLVLEARRAPGPRAKR